MKKPSKLAALFAAFAFIGLGHAQELRYLPLAPDDFAWQWPLTLEAGNDLGRVTLTSEVYARLWRDDLSDIAAFNAENQPIPIALIDANFGRASAPPQEPFDVPLFRVPRGEGKAAVEKLRLRLEQRGTSLEVVADESSLDESGTPSGPQDVILDLSGYADTPIVALLVEFAPDANRLNARADVAGSANLSDWKPLARSQALVALDEDGLRLERRRIEFAATNLPYLRIRRTDRFDSLPIAGVRAVRAPATNGWPVSNLATTQPNATPQHDLPGAFLYTSAGPFPVERLEVHLAERNAAATVIIESRANNTLPWRERARGSVFQIGQGNAVESSPFQLGTPIRDRNWRARTEPAQAKAPSLQLGYRPDQFIFAAQGQAPYRLVAGSARAQRGSYPLHNVFTAKLKAEGEAWLPKEAHLGHGAELAGGAALAPRPDTSGSPSAWQWLLWLLLLAGAFAVISMVLRLLRQSGA